MALINLVGGPSREAVFASLADDCPGGCREHGDVKFWLDPGKSRSIICRVIGVLRPGVIYWRLQVVGRDLPKGYGGATIEIKWSFSTSTGHTDLELSSPCCKAKIKVVLHDGELMLIGSCVACSRAVSRKNPRTGVEEWLNGESPWTTRDDLEPVVRL